MFFQRGIYTEMKKIAFYTLGCKTNQYETEQMREQFEKNGYETVDFNSEADIYVINTCSVTQTAERKSRQAAGRVSKLNKDAVIVLAGCYPQTKKEEIEKCTAADIIIGNNEKNNIVEIVESFCGEKKTQVCDIMSVSSFEDSGIAAYSGKTRAFMKVQDGCDNYCAYCVIPYARGHARSRRQSDIIKEAASLAENGYKEIVLTGIHLTSYGKDTGENLTEMLINLQKIDGIERIRLGSLELTGVLWQVIESAEYLPKLCPHFHMSLQSGSESVLKRMRRRYTPKEFAAAVRKINEVWFNAAVTTDVIAGFPGETEEEYEETVKFVEETGFAKIHVFPYSVRKGTAAAEMSGQLSEIVKRERARRLQKVAKNLEREYLRGNVGKTLNVLAERKLENGMYEGHAENYVKVTVSSNEDIRRKIVGVKITDFTNDALVGKN